MVAFIVALFFIKFIRDQFEFSSINRLSYWIIPIFCCYQFIRTFRWSPLNGGLTLLILLLALAIGRYQARHTRVRLEKTGSQYFRDTLGHEVPIYKKVITAQGGRQYLYGWLAVLIIQLVLEATYLHEVLTPGKVFEEATTEVLADVLTFYRLTGASHGSWILWALTAFSSLAYTLLLARKSPLAKQALFGERKYVSVTDPEETKHSA
ncbi:hypothetical protein [Levilactobacillus acidifarinae]|uniref:Hydrophobic protein n=1 Tax=Levilactobacillus acidifarinae DSM 19394 = JCM 15949 TaxID=1423715 RepID=A0A0R1LU07_9LACO|nr:hypothetical protein [Levilactobacillus acidifarinae]KRK95850.1 hypothetical protein FD25_GL002306 [Levilactobacillus acidifarinae DSM 19394]GEO69148.1 hypothetical protein LAC03_10580 [Levilactobacillus acidifarinae]